MKKIKSRGLKQRYKKKMAQLFGIKEKEKPQQQKKAEKPAQLNNSSKSLLQNKKDRKEQEKNRAAQNNNKKTATTEKQAKPEKPVKVIREASASLLVDKYLSIKGGFFEALKYTNFLSLFISLKVFPIAWAVSRFICS